MQGWLCSLFFVMAIYIKNILKKIDFWGAILVFSITFFVYSLTLAPTISPGDGAELITAAYTWGTAHPPGYPLLTLLWKVFITIFPFGNIAWRVNLFNAFLGALTAIIVYLIIYKLLKKQLRANSDKKESVKNKVIDELLFIIPAVLGSLFLSFSSAFWFYSITAEVFSLHHFFAALLILTVLIWREKSLNKEKNSHRWLYFLCFLAGLSFTNQQNIVFLGPALLFLVFVTVVSTKEIRFYLERIPIMIIFVILGLAPYIYLPIATSFGKSFYWGNPDSAKGVLDTILRKGYGGLPVPKLGYFSFAETLKDNLFFYFKFLFFHFTLIGIVLGLLGARILRYREKILFFFFLLAFLFTGIIFFLYLGDLKLEQPDLVAVAERFIPLSEVTAAVFIGFGFFFLIEKISHLLKTRGLRAAVPLLFLPYFLIPLATHYPFVDHSKNYFFYNFGEDILDYLDKDALLISKGDLMFFSTLYLQNVENKRTDVKIIHEAFLNVDWYINYIKKKYPEVAIPYETMSKKGTRTEKAKEIIAANINKMPIYYPTVEESKILKPDFFLLQRDIFLQVFKVKPDFSPEEYIEKNSEFYKKSKLIRDPRLYQNDKWVERYPVYNWENDIAATLLAAHANKCLLLDDLKKYSEAEKECQQALFINSKFVPAYSNLGSIYLKRGLYDKALEMYQKIIEIEPGDLDTYKIIISIYKDYLKDEKKANEYLQKYIENRIK